MQVTGKYIGKSESHLYFSSWYGSPNFRVRKDKTVLCRVELNSKIVTFKDLDDVELLPYGFDFSKAVKCKNA